MARNAEYEATLDALRVRARGGGSGDHFPSLFPSAFPLPPRL